MQAQENKGSGSAALRAGSESANQRGYGGADGFMRGGWAALTGFCSENGAKFVGSRDVSADFRRVFEGKCVTLYD